MQLLPAMLLGQRNERYGREEGQSSGLEGWVPSVIPLTQEAKAGGWQIQSQPQQLIEGQLV